MLLIYRCLANLTLKAEVSYHCLYFHFGLRSQYIHLHLLLKMLELVLHLYQKGKLKQLRSIGLTRPQMVKLIIIPQALRVIIPPTISQYLNLTKNSSLAMAVGYEEVVAVWANISLNQTGQALIIIAMTIIFFEICSLFTSFILNIYNRRIQITER